MGGSAVYRHIIMILLSLVILTVSAEGAPPRRAAAPQLPALTILSIIPAQGEPGMTVTLNGTGFTDRTSVFLGAVPIPATETGGRILTFELPDVSPGAYALYLRREDGATSRPFNFMVLPQKPVANSLSPDAVSVCAFGREREVVVSGAHFDTSSRVLFDGAAIATRFISPGALAFLAPQLGGGLHQIQVKNGSDALSGTLALFLESKPEILSVAVGADNVSAYDLIINGKNFQQSSTLIVDGNRVGTGQQVVREQLIYNGCNQLIYQRHPYDPTPKEIRLQVVNPGGEESGVFSISAP
jgi:hypothetical protein